MDSPNRGGRQTQQSSEHSSAACDVLLFLSSKPFRSALNCLTAIEEKCERMREEKARLQSDYDAIEKETERLQEELFAKSTLIERLKGKLGMSSSG